MTGYEFSYYRMIEYETIYLANLISVLNIKWSDGYNSSGNILKISSMRGIKSKTKTWRKTQSSSRLANRRTIGAGYRADLAVLGFGFFLCLFVKGALKEAGTNMTSSRRQNQSQLCTTDLERLWFIAWQMFRHEYMTNAVMSKPERKQTSSRSSVVVEHSSQSGISQQRLSGPRTQTPQRHEA